MSTIVVTGMGRSGTSAVDSILERAGVDMGERQVPPGHDNPRGFFEDLELVEFHQGALARRGIPLFVPEGFRFEPTDDERAAARKLVDTRRSKPVWGWKDPRTVFFLGFWRANLPEARFLLLYRHPLEVLLSLLRIGQVPSFGLLDALDAWSRYNRALVEFWRANRGVAALCHVRALVEHPEAFRSLLKEKLGLALPVSAVGEPYHRDELRRLPVTPAVAEILRSVHPDAAGLYAELGACDLSEAEPVDADTPGLAALAAFRTRFGREDVSSKLAALLLLVSLVGPEIGEAYVTRHAERVREAERGKVWLESQWRAWRDTAAEREQALSELRPWIAELEQGKQWLEGKVRSLEKRCLELEESLGELRAYCARLESTRAFRAMVRLSVLPERESKGDRAGD